MTADELETLQADRKRLLTLLATQIDDHQRSMEALHHAREQLIKLIAREESKREMSELRELVRNYECGLRHFA